MKGNYLYVSLIALLLLISCEGILDPPDDKLPAKLNFSFSMETHTLISDSPNMQSASHGVNSPATGFVLEQGAIVVENISFDGRRGEGRNDVFFTSDFEQPYHILLGDEASFPGISFDIPQGIYPMVEITLHLGTDQEAAIVMDGQFYRGIFQPVLVRYEYNFSEQIRIRAVPGQHAQQIVFSKDEVLNASVVLHTESLLRLLNFGMIMQAETVMLNGQEVILINEQTNPSIYNSISSRLQQAFTLVID